MDGSLDSIRSIMLRDKLLNFSTFSEATRFINNFSQHQFKVCTVSLYALNYRLKEILNKDCSALKGLGVLVRQNLESHVANIESKVCSTRRVNIYFYNH